MLKIPLDRRTRNHLRSMYFGALCCGADAAGALLALRAIEGKAVRYSILFKEARAEFHKRAEGDVHFACEQGREIRELLRRAEVSGEREHLPVRVVATVPSLLGSEPVASFDLTLSVKKRS